LSVPVLATLRIVHRQLQKKLVDPRLPQSMNLNRSSATGEGSQPNANAPQEIHSPS
jgi:hypothetical protein